MMRSGPWEWSVGECGIIDRDSIVPIHRKRYQPLDAWREMLEKNPRILCGYSLELWGCDYLCGGEPRFLRKASLRTILS
jgi:hypothetical protein